MTDTIAPPAAAPQPDEAIRAYPWWAILLQGIAAVLLGIALWVYPGKTSVLVVTFIGWWWLIGGIFELISLFWDRRLWGWKVFSAILGIVAGGYIIAAPIIGTAVVAGTIALLIGINGMIIGVADIVKAFQGAGWGKFFLGLLSLVLGGVIAFNFTRFALTLPWVFAILGVGFGIAAIVTSFQVKKLQS